MNPEEEEDQSPFTKSNFDPTSWKNIIVWLGIALIVISFLVFKFTSVSEDRDVKLFILGGLGFCLLLLRLIILAFTDE
jgi:hypothetical protein